MSSNKPWPPEQVVILTSCWATHTASQIAVMVNKSRSAVMGKVDRMKLSGTVKNLAHKPVRRRAINRARGQAILAKLANVEPPKLECIPGGISLFDLQSHHCRAIIGHGDDSIARFCGAQKSQKLRTMNGQPILKDGGDPVFDTVSFCAFHAKEYYQQC